MVSHADDLTSFINELENDSKFNIKIQRTFGNTTFAFETISKKTNLEKSDYRIIFQLVDIGVFSKKKCMMSKMSDY